ncbi:Fanconi anemia group M isoform X3 [Chlorella sorokiniana]|uniref:Fanconi anemia group M isoform X3 n=1 Tax=Chlorella sorokiniana TaxID=3076 RepID=A0A2P6U2N5_CHLSO|nr:Fanconi anemia group M isoform X3 [Chlorella sorokiniana]|eukprot:PRW60577.1 Fanconi anemia group M isoform X3 [Chlorella sorokiniana]
MDSDDEELDLAALEALERQALAQRHGQPAPAPAQQHANAGGWPGRGGSGGSGASPFGGAEMGGEGAEGDLIPVNTTSGGIRLHRVSARHWVFPKGVSQREYQLACIQTALLTNTLVCLPTGLGKTLIAAVVMHNFARWFPEGKVVFVAPTKPLVAQQVDACHSFMGMSKAGFCELTGSINPEARKELWQGGIKRVFFCTPQTYWNDVKRGICPYDQVVCLVVDECHRATGNSEIVRAVTHMREARCKFRVLGLSATPGADGGKVQEVVTNLMVGAIEFRTEQDPDVARHTHPKDISVQVVHPSREAEQLRSQLLGLIRSALQPLLRDRVYTGNPNPDSVHHFTLMQARNAVSNSGRGGHNPYFTAFSQAMALVQVRDQLDQYGVGQALSYLNAKCSDGYMRALLSNSMFAHFRQTLESVVRNGSSSPKLAALVQTLRQHFQTLEAGGSGRAIVFTNYRDGVMGICEALKQHEPLITARAFIGQGAGGKSGAGMSQKEQKEVLQGFRSGAFNCLVATCIGEEGLDIPQVDLIVCYDATSSPTRSIQRMGRTGRHKEGRVVYILAAGREAEAYNKIEENTKALHRRLRNPRGFDMWERAPRMLPHAYEPQRMDVAVEHTPEKVPEPKASGRGRGRGSGKARGSGRGTSGRGGRGSARRRPSGRGAAAVIDSESDGERLDAGDGIEPAGAAAGAVGWQFEPVAEAAEEFEALMVAGGSEDAAAGGSGGKANGKAGGKAKASGRGKASKRGRAVEAVVLDGSCDGELPPAGGAAGPADEAAAAEADELWGGPGDFDADADMLPEDDALQPAAPGMPQPGSPQPASPALPPELLQQQQPAVQHQLLFPEASGTVLRWDRAGRLAIAPPPTLEALLAAVGTPAAAPNLSQSSGDPSEGADAPAPAAAGDAPAAPVPTPPPSQQQPVLPPLLAEDGLVLQRRTQAGGAVQQDLLRFDDPAAHRWAFLGAAGASPAGQQAVEPEADAAQPAAAAQAAAQPAPVPAAAAAGKKSGKASKPRKRKPAGAAAAVADAPPAGEAAEAAGVQPKKRKSAKAAADQAAAAAAAAAELPALLPAHQQHVVQPQEQPQWPAAGEAEELSLSQMPLAQRKQQHSPSPQPLSPQAGQPPGSATESLSQQPTQPRSPDDGGEGKENASQSQPEAPGEITYSQLPLAQRLQQRKGGCDGAAQQPAPPKRPPSQQAAADALQPPAEQLAAPAPQPQQQLVRRRSQVGSAERRRRQRQRQAAEEEEEEAAMAPSDASPEQQRLGHLAGGSAGAGDARAAQRRRQEQLQGAQERKQRKADARRRAASFLDVEAGLSGDDDSGDEIEEDDGFLAEFIDDATPASASEPPSTDGRAYRQPLPGGASPSPMAAFRLMQQRRAQREQQFQDTPGASGPPGGGQLGLRVAGGGGGWQLYQDGAAGYGDEEDEYDLEDSFLVNESDVVTEAPDSHDDRCAACGSDQGDLLLCDGCPAVYHPRCCGLRGVPSGDWFCPVCSDGRTPSHQRRAKQRRQLQRSTAKTGAGGGRSTGAGEAAGRQGGSRLARQQQQQQTPEGGSSGGQPQEDGWEDWGAAAGGSGGGGGDTPSWDLL